MDKKIKFKKGMILAVNVIPGGGDTSSIMVIDTAKLSNVGEDKKWLNAIREELDGEQKTYPEEWDVLEKARILDFPVKIDGVANLFYEVE